MAVRFDATGESYTIIGTDMADPVQTAWTVCAWVKIVVDRNTLSPVIGMDNGTGDWMNFGTTTDGTTLKIFDHVVTSGLGTRALTVGTWYFVAASINGTNGTMVTRAFTEASVTAESLTGFDDTLSIVNFRIGSDVQGGWINGSVTAVKLWTGVALTSAELAAESWQHAPARPDNLAMWYPLIEPELTDHSGNGRDLTGGTGATYEPGPDIFWQGPPPPKVAPSAAVVRRAVR